MGQFFAFQDIYGGGKFDFEWSDLFDHNRRIFLAIFKRFGFLTARHASDEPVYIPDKLPYLLPRRENFHLFFKLQGFSSSMTIFFCYQMSANRATRLARFLRRNQNGQLPDGVAG
jgi:hypothetical protein